MNVILMEARVSENGNGMMSVKWVYGLIAAVFGIVFTVMVNGFSGHVAELDRRVASTERSIAGIEVMIRQVEDLLKITRAEQVDRTIRFADITGKINGIDNKLLLLEDRYKTLDEKILSGNIKISAINGRLDKMVPVGGSKVVPRDGE